MTEPKGVAKVRTDDGCIIRECLGGETEAFGVLVDKYKGGIYAFAYAKLGNFQDAQDVTQEAFLKAYRNLSSLRRWESFGFWLYRIAYNLCGEWVKARARRPDREFIEDQDPRTLASSSLDSYREYQLDESVQDALDSLSEAYREVLMLHYFGGMNSKEIATVLGTSPTAVRMRLSRARAQLREEMVTMMDTAFEGHRLQASFTFRIVEGVKRIKINPMPRMTAPPVGTFISSGDHHCSPEPQPASGYTHPGKSSRRFSASQPGQGAENRGDTCGHTENLPNANYL
jgi:RNA polymerase sigma factor (sigma-70 family)